MKCLFSGIFRRLKKTSKIVSFAEIQIAIMASLLVNIWPVDAVTFVRSSPDCNRINHESFSSSRSRICVLLDHNR